MRQGIAQGSRAAIQARTSPGVLQELRELGMPDEWEGCGLDTVHLTFKESGDLGIGDLVLGLGDLLDEVGLSGDFSQRNRGRNGFEHGLSFLAGVEVDWTDAGSQGPNRASISCQFKGEFFATLGAFEVALFGLSMAEYGVHRCTRADVQITALNCPSAPDLIRDFRAGKLRVVRKKSFEPKGQELEGGRYPKGATICHGARQSDVFVRQYDKDKEEGNGPQRLRSECELKGQIADGAWNAFVNEWKEGASATAPDLGREVKLSQQLIRQYMPLRDVSQWAPDARPKNWASEAPEPAWWADLFSEQAVRIRRKKAISKSLRDAIAYNRRQGGGRLLQDLILTELDLSKRGYEAQEAAESALCTVRDRYAKHGSESRLEELLRETPVEDHEWIRARWVWYGRNGASNPEAEDDGPGSYPPL